MGIQNYSLRQVGLLKVILVLALVFVVSCTGVEPGAGAKDTSGVVRRVMPSPLGETVVPNPDSTSGPADDVDQAAADDDEDVDEDVDGEGDDDEEEDDEEPIQPVPSLEDVLEELEVDEDPKLVALGERLFHDSRLSSDDTMSCATCHDLRYGGVDRAPTATGIRGQIGPINTPTVYNSALNIAQFWDGRAEDLEAQAGGPPLAEGEMGSTWPEILGKLRKDDRFVKQFADTYEDVQHAADIKKDHVLKAIAMFEMTLVTPHSRFDRWLKGDATAISAETKRGYELFKSVGCADCHYGPHVGGKTYQRLGKKREFFTDKARISHVDQGRFNVTKDERDRHVFKVPSLRNVELTGPWFHNGEMKTLEDAVNAMARHQLDVELKEKDTAAIVAFLRSLTGYYQGRFLGAPFGLRDPSPWRPAEPDAPSKPGK